jgi:tetratricopeptide (TPR) repeat protein
MSMVEYDKAIADYSEAIRLEPGSTHNYVSRGSAWFAKGEHDRAIADHSEAIRLDPKGAEAYRSRAESWAGKKEYDRAIVDYGEAIRLDPKNSWAYDGCADAHAQKKEYDAALAVLDKALQENPADFGLRSSRGFVCWKAGRHDKALADLDEAVRLDGKSAQAHGCRALFLAACATEKYRDGKAAVEDGTRACELSGWKEAWALSSLAAAHAERGEFAKAVELQEKAQGLLKEEDELKLSRERLALYQVGKPYRMKPGRD